MMIVTAGSHHKPFEATIRYCEARCKEYGYKIDVYDLGGLGFGSPIKDVRLSSEFSIVR